MTPACFYNEPLPCAAAATLGRLPDTCPGIYRNRAMYARTLEEPGMLLLRVDCPIYFANTQVHRAGPCMQALRGALEGLPPLWACMPGGRCLQRS